MRLDKNLGLWITCAVLLLGSAAYLGLGGLPGDAYAVLEESRYKATFSDEGGLKVFALADEDDLARLRAADGVSTVTRDTIVIGSDEAAMMRAEKLFEGLGNPLENLFGINTSVGGVLRETKTPVDMLHFVDEAAFAQLDAQERIFVKMSPEGVPKLFFTAPSSQEISFPLAEGNLSEYRTLARDGKTYVPVIIGSDEAAMMRAEKLFRQPGDTIEGFFGTDVVVVGILAPTGSLADMLHFLPLRSEELNP